MQISGDGDLYVSTGDVLPSKNDYIWKSSNFGNDVFKLSYDDGSYCTAVSPSVKSLSITVN